MSAVSPRRLAAALALAGLLGARHADAEPRAEIDATRMSRETDRYFQGEKAEGWVFAGVGAGAIGASATLFAAGEPLRRGLSYPVFAIGLVELAAGVVLLFRTDSQLHDLQRQLGNSPAAFQEGELARMKKVEREFVWLELTELALTAVGLGLATYGGFAQDGLVAGIGAGLAAQSAIMLTFDHFAAERASRYVRALSGFGRRGGLGVAPTAGGGALAWSISF